VLWGRMSGNNRIDEGERALNDVQGPRRYMVGDRIVVELDLEHRMNLARIFVAFHHETDPLTEFYFETTSFPEEPWQASHIKMSQIVLEAAIPPETIPGLYTLNRINVFSVGGTLAHLREDSLSGISDRSFEIIEEPAELPTVSGLRFLS
jgi:hypothetical protein